MEQFQKALSRTAGSGNRKSEIMARIGIGLVYRSLSEPQRAWEQYREAGGAAETKDQMAELLTSAGELFQSVGMTAKASETLDLAISLMQETGNRSGLAAALAILARTHLSSGQLGRALYDNNEALRLTNEAEDRLGEASAQAGIGDVYFWAALRSAHPDLKPVPPLQKDQYSPFDLRTLDPALVRGAKLESFVRAAQMKYMNLALTHYGAALGIMRKMDNRAGEFGILTNIVSVYDLWNEPKQALEHYHKAIEVPEGMRTTAGLEEFKEGLLQQYIDVYRRALSLHILLNQHLAAFDLSERARARSLLDQLGNTRIGTRSGQNTELASIGPASFLPDTRDDFSCPSCGAELDGPGGMWRATNGIPAADAGSRCLSSRNSGSVLLTAISG